MNPSPLVSLIITAQNEVWFEEALASVLAQDYPYCEIIVADYSAMAFVGQITTAHQPEARFPLRHLTFTRDHKTVLEEAIQAAQGKYIKFLSQSELLAESCVTTLVEALETYPHCVLAASKRQRISPQGKSLPDVLATAAITREPGVLSGEGLLRYQSQLGYNLLGELSATLLPREALLSVIASDTPLIVVNDQVVPDVAALKIYSALLQQGDVAWFPQPLCSVRVSEIHTQPHQRESDEKVKVARDTVMHTLRASRWYQERKAQPADILFTPLASPEQTTRLNLKAVQQHYLSQNALVCWQAERTLMPHQLAWQAERAAQGTPPVSLAIIIQVEENNAAGVVDTLTSLAEFSSPLLTLQPLLVGTLSETIADVPFFAATPQTRVAVINDIIAQRDANWFLCVDAGSLFQPSGLARLAATLPDSDNILALYADEFFYINGEPSGLNFRPDFNLDMLLSSPKMLAQHWLFRRELLLAAEGFDPQYPSAIELDLILKMIESQGLNVVGHLAEPLLTAHLKARDIATDAQLLQRHLLNRGYPEAEIALDSFYNFRLRYNHADKPTVSIAILANHSLPALITCVTTLMEKTRYQHYELLIVADDKHSAERDNWLTAIAGVDPQRIRVLHYAHSFHHSEMANLAATQARGDYLMLMHCELAVTDGDWLGNLLNHAQRPEVAIVGGKQLASDNKIRHAGYILGVNGAAGEVFRGLKDTEPTALGRLHLDQNYSAVSGDFMLVRLAVFTALGGFDREQPLHGDVDFCLRARNEGYMTVWTPYARILRAAERKNPFAGENRHDMARLKQTEEDKLFARWLPLIGHDPAFNDNLSLRSRHFEINSDNPLGWRPSQRSDLPQILVNHADTFGCGNYRMIKPFRAMEREQCAEGINTQVLLNMSELAQLKPDSLVIQRRSSPAFQTWIERAGKLHDVFKVFELDDYILNLPMKHYNRASFKQDIVGEMRKTLGYFDRFVVSTAPLADAMKEMHPDIQVVPNCLPVEWWGNLHSLRNQGKKPRVGWAGGSSHQGDLEMIVDVVKAFTNDVEWVFMGMCPPKLRPYVHEIHHGVDIDLYPAKMASLNLDLALAPVEDNIFNVCKSNLRLLEYGACGIPVVCSDVECYRNNDLPVTRVKNRFKDWCDAIRMHLSDDITSAESGRQLRRQIHKDWMLTGDNVSNWLKSWMP